MAFKDWTELDQGAELELPIKGRTYLIVSPPGRVGLRVQGFMEQATRAARAQENGDQIELDEAVLDDANELDLYRDVLGPAYQQMLDDGVAMAAIKHATLTAMMWITYDQATAEAVWEGKAPTAALKNRSAAASTTRSPASGSGTSNRTGRRRRTGRRSHGRRSSNGGRS